MKRIKYEKGQFTRGGSPVRVPMSTVYHIVKKNMRRKSLRKEESTGCSMEYQQNMLCYSTWWQPPLPFFLKKFIRLFTCSHEFNINDAYSLTTWPQISWKWTFQELVHGIGSEVNSDICLISGAITDFRFLLHVNFLLKLGCDKSKAIPVQIICLLKLPFSSYFYFKSITLSSYLNYWPKRFNLVIYQTSSCTLFRLRDSLGP